MEITKPNRNSLNFDIMEECKIVIGKNFGDEGKGLAVDYFARNLSKTKYDTIVIRHNGGAQAGHTVERENMRFVFHQLSSASFCGCPTFMSETFLPDMMKIEEEIQQFSDVSGMIPKIYVDSDCSLTSIYDVIVNSFVESLRGENRHGSCGMGINEAVVRNRKNEYRFTLKMLSKFSLDDTTYFLEKIRAEYVPERLDELNISLKSNNQWSELLNNSDISFNAAEIMHNSLKYINIVENTSEFLKQYKNIIFENAQGLMLDMDNIDFFPHLTPSHTGCKNPFELLDKCGIEYNVENTEICYVTRSYITRHGAGFLPYECAKNNINPYIQDLTNIPNEWQQSLRFAKHGNINEFLEYIVREYNNYNSAAVSLFFTHLNETSGNIITNSENIAVNDFIVQILKKFRFKKFYLSTNKCSEKTVVGNYENAIDK